MDGSPLLDFHLDLAKGFAMLRGVRVNGELIRFLRNQKGKNQKQLAEAAGVCERTIRNAEKSCILEAHIATYIAVALDTILDDLVLERPEEQRSKSLKKWIAKFCSAYSGAIFDEQELEFLELFLPDAQWNCRILPAMPQGDLFQGKKEISSLLESMRHCLSESEVAFDRLTMGEFDGEGDLLYFHCQSESSLISSATFWSMFVCRFEDGLIKSLEQCLSICDYRKALMFASTPQSIGMTSN